MKKHWYSFSYEGANEDGTGHCVANCYVGYYFKGITKPMIQENKKAAGVSQDAALLSVSYLGKMTREQFLGEE